MYINGSLQANSDEIYCPNIWAEDEGSFDKSDALLFIASEQNTLKHFVGFDLRKTGEWQQKRLSHNFRSVLSSFITTENTTYRTVHPVASS